MTVLALTLFTWDGETAEVNLGGLLVVVFVAAMVWGMVRD